MKKIYIRENQTNKIGGKDKNLLPQFLFKLVKKHNTSLGDNPAFPPIENFDYIILKKRLKQLNVILEANDLGGLNETELLNELSKTVASIKKVETAYRPQLEMICENAINRIFAFPKDIVNFKCELVDKIKPTGKERITPEEKNDNSYSFEDLNDIKFSNGAIAKRRIINSLIQGGAHSLINEFDAYSSDIHKLNPNLMGMYHKAMVINEYLTFVKREEVSDKKQMQGAYVSVKLVANGNKCEIASQAIIFPLLLIESIRGFLELFSSHGLPNDPQKAKYVISQADFLVAEPFDIRFGLTLWDMILPQSSSIKSKVIPYYFMKLCKLKTENFNKVMQEMLGGTKRGERLKLKLLDYANDMQEYSGFEHRMNARKLDKAQINDGYFTAAELDSFNEEDIENQLHESFIFESRAEDNARKVIKQYDPYATHEEREQMFNEIRANFPLLRNGKVKKYIYGITRFWVNGDIDEQDIKSINVILKYIESNQELMNELDAGLKLFDLAEEFIHDYYDKAIDFLNNQKVDNIERKHYTIVKIKSFKEATKYNKYLLPGSNAWCITWSQPNYDSYTDNDESMFYFCLADGFENIDCTPGRNVPKDEYGLSMIALNIAPDGSLKNSTTRWNHDRGGTDESFTIKEIEQLMGVSFTETFKPRKESEIPIDVVTELSNGLSVIRRRYLMYIIDKNTGKEYNKHPMTSINVLSEENETFIVSYKNVIGFFVLDNTGKELLFFRDFETITDSNSLIISNESDTARKIINKNTLETISEVYPDISDASSGFAIVTREDGKMTYMSTETGKLIYNGFKWFDNVTMFYRNFGVVEEDSEITLVRNDGKLIEYGRFWFDRVWKRGVHDFSNPERGCDNSIVAQLGKELYIINEYGKVINKKHPVSRVSGVLPQNKAYVCLDMNGNHCAIGFDGKFYDKLPD